MVFCFYFYLDPDSKQIVPDPGKRSGSNRIWVHNTAFCREVFKMTYRIYMVGFFFSGLLKTWGGPATPLDGDYPRKVINNDRMHFSCTIVTLSQNPRLSVTIWSACSACVILQYRYRTADGKYKLFKVNIKVSEDWDPNFEFAFVCKFLSLPYLCRIRIWVSKIFGYGVEFELFYSASATPVLI